MEPDFQTEDAPLILILYQQHANKRKYSSSLLISIREERKGSRTYLNWTGCNQWARKTAPENPSIGFCQKNAEKIRSLTGKGDPGSR